MRIPVPIRGLGTLEGDLFHGFFCVFSALIIPEQLIASEKG